jgi:predicted nicotinamide N-methyase
MSNAVKTDIRAHGVRVLLSRHSEIRKLKRLNTPSFHGNKLWSSSWLLMDYFKRRGLRKGARVMEVGCGWGLAGIYCAKKHGARVTGVDKDSEVFPYLRLHADINKVKITTMKKAFAGVRDEDLKAFDVVIGADICFWDAMVDPLKRFIRRALGAGVRVVLIADPGRPTFEEIGQYFVKKGRGEIFDWTTQRPRRIRGRILKIGSNGR